MNYAELLRLAAPEAVLVVTAFVVLALGLWKTHAATLCSGAAAAGLLFAASAALLLPPDATFANGMLVITPLICLFKIICLALAFFTVILSRQLNTPHHGEYLGLLLLATVGLMLLVGSEELLVIFIGLELTGLSLYVMAAFDKNDLRSAEAGLKYFLFGSTASAFTLFGISLVYGMTGATNLAIVATKLAPVTPLLMAGLVMTLIGFAFKIAAAPFHLWAPDTYQGAPAPSVAFIASASKVASFFVLGKILLVGFGPTQGSAGWQAMIPGWAPLLAVLAALSILIGNLVALAQTNVRRLLAYSAVAHAGYTLLGLVAGGRDGFSATLFYTTIYAFTLVGAFGVVALVRRETGGDDFSHFAGLRRRSSWLAGCMAVFMLSLAGIPPLAGFFGKFYLFAAALRVDGQNGLLWLVALALLGSLISFYYYLMVLKVIFVDNTETTSPKFQVDLMQKAAVGFLAVIVLLLGLFPGGLVWKITSSLP